MCIINVSKISMEEHGANKLMDTHAFIKAYEIAIQKQTLKLATKQSLPLSTKGFYV